VADPNQKTLFAKFREDLKKTSKWIDEEKVRYSSNVLKGKSVRFKLNKNESSSDKAINHTYTVKFFDPNSSRLNTISTFKDKIFEFKTPNTVSDKSPRSKVLKTKEAWVNDMAVNTPIKSNKKMYQGFFKTQAVVNETNSSIGKYLNNTQSFFQFNKEKMLSRVKSNEGNLSEFNSKLLQNEKSFKLNSKNTSKYDHGNFVPDSLPVSNFNLDISDTKLLKKRINTNIFATEKAKTKYLTPAERDSENKTKPFALITNHTYTTGDNKFQQSPNNKTSSSTFSRIKSYKVSYLGNWHEKTRLPISKILPCLISDSDYLFSAISDEIKILLDNFSYFKINYLNGLEMLPAFKNLIRKSQTNFNRTIEETCGLLREIPKLLLLDFTQYMNRFITIRPPSPNRFQSTEVKNEAANFNVNCNLLNNLGIYLKTSFEVYTILISQIADLNMNIQKFNILTEFLARSRYNLSNLVMTARNAITNFRQDTLILEKYKISSCSSIKIPESTNILSKNTSNYIAQPHSIKVSNQTVDRSNKFIESELIEKKYFFKKNEEAQRKRRLKFIFEEEKEENENKFNCDDIIEMTALKQPPRNSVIVK